MSTVWGQGDFSWLDGQRPIYGLAVQSAQLRGKVVMVIYWQCSCGITCGDMVDVQKKQTPYSQTGKFYLITSHLEPPSDTLKKFPISNRITFPVYPTLRYLAPESGMIMLPYAYLIDKSGTIVGKGDPKNLLPMVPALIAKNPPTGFGGASHYGILENPLKVLPLKEIQNVVDYFEPGKPWAIPYKKIATELKKNSSTNDSYKTILETVDTYILENLQKLETLAEKKLLKRMPVCRYWKNPLKELPREKRYKPS